jgi:hypothetical protein
MAESDARAAAERLEAAVDRLAEAIPAALARPAPPGVPAEDVAALAERLNATIARLRAALGEAAAARAAGEEG